MDKVKTLMPFEIDLGYETDDGKENGEKFGYEHEGDGDVNLEGEEEEEEEQSRVGGPSLSVPWLGVYSMMVVWKMILAGSNHFSYTMS